jgi:cell division protease FtsH
MMPNPRRAVSAETAKEIDGEVKGLVEEGHQRALDILNANRELLEAIAVQLLEGEVIEGEPLKNWLSQVQVPDHQVLAV